MVLCFISGRRQKLRETINTPILSKFCSCHIKLMFFYCGTLKSSRFIQLRCECFIQSVFLLFRFVSPERRLKSNLWRIATSNSSLNKMSCLSINFWFIHNFLHHWHEKNCSLWRPSFILTWIYPYPFYKKQGVGFYKTMLE